jgi:hypothetical protein
MSLQRTVRTRTSETCIEEYSNLVKDENGDLLADYSNNVNWWKSYISQLLNGHHVSDLGR